MNNLSSAAAKTKTRNILGWIGSSPTPLTIQELEQALLVDVEDIQSSVRVSSSLNVVQLCGPIVEVVDEYVQFVHFTVKEYAALQAKIPKKINGHCLANNLVRYIFNPRIDGFIDNTEATLNLAQCCIWYLCQSHHDAWIPDDEIEENIISGQYRLHNYAVTMWLELVKKYVSLNGSKPLSSKLIRALECLVKDRSRSEIAGSTELAGQSHQPEFEKFKYQWPELHTMLRQMVQFHWRCSRSEYQMSKGEKSKLRCNLFSPKFQQEIYGWALNPLQLALYRLKSTRTLTNYYAGEKSMKTVATARYWSDITDNALLNAIFYDAHFVAMDLPRGFSETRT